MTEEQIKLKDWLDNLTEAYKNFREFLKYPDNGVFVECVQGEPKLYITSLDYVSEVLGLKLTEVPNIRDMDKQSHTVYVTYNDVVLIGFRED